VLCEGLRNAAETRKLVATSVERCAGDSVTDFWLEHIDTESLTPQFRPIGLGSAASSAI
jgi:hypothetical protein